jgi:hypothetical protein
MMSCRAAILGWAAAMQALPAGAAAESRGILFFSGHGLEIWLDNQVLLPSDYLAPPYPVVNDAISTQNLRRGLSALPVPNHYLFLDACRNDVERLRQLDLAGQKILNEPAAAAVNKDALIGILYAAASGTQTWQPRELELGYSLFGGAMIDGLEGHEGLERKGCTPTTCEVHFYPLETFVKAGMGTALTRFNSPEKVRVRNGGTPPDGWITTVPVITDLDPAPPPPPATVTGVLEERYDVHTTTPWPVTGDRVTAHDSVFGSERMTDIWSTAQAVDLSSGMSVPRDQIVVTSVRHSDDTGAFRITLRLPHSPRGHWLQFTDAIGKHFACALPGDTVVTPLYDIEIDLQHEAPGEGWSPSWISRLESGLSADSPEMGGKVARIWETYQTHNVARAADAVHLGMLEDAVQGKMKSPLAAAVAATVLLRANRLDLLHATWLRNLSDWFPQLPDGAVLWAEQLRLQSTQTGEPVDDERRTHLARIAERGLPLLSEVLPLAGRQIAELGTGDPVLGPLGARIDAALRHYRPGGMFAVFSSQVDPLRSELVR